MERLGFTVALTIMVFQLKPPEHRTFAALLPLLSTALSYVMSYCFIAIVPSSSASLPQCEQESIVR
jgi:uncharacterized membrane protein